jgi:hypothetical protein
MKFEPLSVVSNSGASPRLIRSYPFFIPLVRAVFGSI